MRLRTDIPILYREEGKIEERLKPYLSIFLRDKDKKLIEGIDAGKEFFKRLVDHTAYKEYVDVLDSIETDFYEIFKERSLPWMDMLTLPEKKLRKK